jgi:hypothetical protein
LYDPHFQQVSLNPELFSGEMMLLRILFAVCLALLATNTSAAQHLEMAASGDIQSSETGELVLRGAVHGDGEGTLRATFRVAGANLVGGQWTITLLTRHADGSTSESGVLVGRIEPGPVVTDSADAVVAMRDVKLVLTDGDGEYAGLSEGAGTLDVQMGLGTEPFQASLSLTF